uniref:RRM domain-containing protein n=1 Tax=Globodera pallida TaxID=36090 RepID=A0A183BJV0_GLOPA
MVKLFVGNLADSIHADNLRGLFQRYVQVQECDVLKHVSTNVDAEVAIQKFNKYYLEGKAIHVERSTNGRQMVSVGIEQKGLEQNFASFTCGAEEHKTSECPKNQCSSRRKRERDSFGEESAEAKKPKPSDLVAGKPKPLIFDNDVSSITHPFPAQVNCWGYKVEGGSSSDPELPRPQNPELRTLYEQYLESRTRYFFYREQLNKELRLQDVSAAVATATVPTIQYSNATDTNPPIIRVDLTRQIRSQGQAAPIITVFPENNNYNSNTNQQLQHQHVYSKFSNALPFCNSPSSTLMDAAPLRAWRLEGKTPTASFQQIVMQIGKFYSSYSAIMPPELTTEILLQIHMNFKLYLRQHLNSRGISPHDSIAYGMAGQDFAYYMENVRALPDCKSFPVDTIGDVIQHKQPS